MRNPSFERIFFCALALLVGAIALRPAMPGIVWSDFFVESWPSYVALHHGDVDGFLAAAPEYGGFLALVGVPMTYAAAALGFDDFRPAPGDDLSVIYAATAIPALVALGWLTVALAQRARARGRGLWDALIVLVAGAPIAYLALQFGHPEDVLAGASAVASVLAARSGRIVVAGALLVLAVLCDEWSLLAILPAALAAPKDGTPLAVGGAIACGAVLVAGELVFGGSSSGVWTSAGAIFHGHHWLYPLGVAPGAGVALRPGATTVAPHLLSTLIHPLIVALSVALCALWWWRGGRAERRRDDALALLALVFLVRCGLDPWNIHYFHLPLILALAAWEVQRGRTPILTAVSAAAVWGSFQTYTEHYGAGPYLLYLSWSLPLAGYLGYRLFAARRVSESRALARPALVPTATADPAA
jgi:hypothetical protein